MSTNRTKRTHILLPVDLLREIDAVVGSRGRSAFLVETAREGVQRRKLLHFLDSKDPAWSPGHHPELSHGSAAFVRHLRNESDTRTKKSPRRSKPQLEKPHSKKSRSPR